jgi:hypothetical protein
MTDPSHIFCPECYPRISVRFFRDQRTGGVGEKSPVFSTVRNVDQISPITLRFAAVATPVGYLCRLSTMNYVGCRHEPRSAKIISADASRSWSVYVVSRGRVLGRPDRASDQTPDRNPLPNSCPLGTGALAGKPVGGGRSPCARETSTPALLDHAFGRVEC